MIMLLYFKLRRVFTSTQYLPHSSLFAAFGREQLLDILTHWIIAYTLLKKYKEDTISFSYAMTSLSKYDITISHYGWNTSINMHPSPRSWKHQYISITITLALSRTKPEFAAWEQQNRWPACVFAQSDQRLCCSPSGKYISYYKCM